ncbi:MAG: stage III sporulation protein AF [Clostridia bacterium]|nr:stage III sporulation protein AF [Clostridia bacterium]
MENINSFVLSLCACVFAVSIAENLLPEGNVKRAVYFVTALIVLSCFTEPVRELKEQGLDFSVSESTYNDNTDWLNRKTTELFESNVSALVKKTLENIDVKPKAIYVYTDITDDNCIFIDKVRVTVDERYKNRIDEICKTIKEELQLDADVNVR